MVTIHTKTIAYIDAVEQFARRKFRFREEIALLVEVSQNDNSKRLLDELAFHAKFVSHSYNILKRVGFDSDETKKLSSEFRTELEKSSNLLRRILLEAPQDMRDQFLPRFLSISNESMKAFLDFLHELSWIKNYSLDHEKK